MADNPTTRADVQKATREALDSVCAAIARFGQWPAPREAGASLAVQSVGGELWEARRSLDGALDLLAKAAGP